MDNFSKMQSASDGAGKAVVPAAEPRARAAASAGVAGSDARGAAREAEESAGVRGAAASGGDANLEGRGAAREAAERAGVRGVAASDGVVDGDRRGAAGAVASGGASNTGRGAAREAAELTRAGDVAASGGVVSRDARGAGAGVGSTPGSAWRGAVQQTGGAAGPRGVAAPGGGRAERRGVGDSRRKFLGAVTGLAGTLAIPKRVAGANEKIRLGIIGAGDRGSELMRLALECPGVEFAGITDIYTRRLEAARVLAPEARTYLDHRRMLEDNSIDAVIIATPQHLHCEHFVAAMEAGKHAYQEKTLAFTVEQAKKMRAAYEAAGRRRVVQVGHQWTSSGQMTDARRMAASAPMGKVTAVVMEMYRNTPHGKAQWARPVYPDMTPETILWKSFEGEAAPHEFDANRYVNWRFFWDYSGGNVYENMCHQLCFWYKVLNLQIPRSATMTGGLYLWKDGRQVPDTMEVSLEQPEEMQISWSSGFGNNELGVKESALGTDGTLSRAAQVRYAPQKVNQPAGAALLGDTRTPPNAHMQNFFDCIRGGGEPNCPFELGYKVAIACRMAVESYRQKKTIEWRPEQEVIT